MNARYRNCAALLFASARPHAATAALLCAAALTVASPLQAFAQTAAPGTGHTAHHGTTTAAPPTDLQVLSEGEITRWNPGQLRVTLRHGELHNLAMPPMTMVFRVKDAAVLGDLKAGDKVRFRAEQAEGGYAVTHIEKAP